MMDSKLGFLKPSPPIDLQIDIDHHYSSKTYNCGSAVTGNLLFTPRKDTPFESIRVSLLGTATVTRDDIEFAKTTTHHFLRTDMPVPASAYPESKIFQAGHAYSIPFHFIIPYHLTVNACTHKVDSHDVRNAHSRLPPSMDDCERQHTGPRTTVIEYGIYTAIDVQCGGRNKEPKLIGKKHVINVLPYFPEDPPLNIPQMSLEYAVEKTKRIRKNIFSSPDGRITAVALQPKAISIGPDGYGSSESAILIDLAFEPRSPDIQPVSVSSISASLHMQTWSRQAPSIAFPNLGLLRDAYTDYITLYSRKEIQASWMSSPKETRADGESSSTISYSSSIRVPFKLPASKKVFLPTFHTCLVSRTYKIQLCLAIGNTKLRFMVPLQVSMENGKPYLNGYGEDCSLGSATASMDMSRRESYLVQELWPLVSRGSENDVLPGYLD
ncbi:hypothetical protein G7Z17_g1043 [Cylindrodendrum hubeiense]|uniref:Arrestin-like N-terminal domain-containing protein n=1 Tax=Cylindrodendrum hubeiense TaxID=595255 RepID=A0A9P5HFM9_9HYPO|nr:hypothetical protein G7Z17_g1043 [Cylindrodendrum hubeiense]